MGGSDTSICSRDHLHGTALDSMSTSELPADAIQRVLFVASSVHVYNIPPLASTKGYSAANWTADNNKRQIFTARLRIIEDAVPLPDGSGEKLSTNVLLEDPSNGQLFAAAPYTHQSAVEAAIDSSRFFAVRVVGEGGMKAVLGIGFEERSEAIDFGIALQEARKVHHMDDAATQNRGKLASTPKPEVKKDFSLKEGETIHVDIGLKGRRKTEPEPTRDEVKENKALFSIAPPPPVDKGGGDGGALSSLPPPPPVSEKRRSKTNIPPAADLGFDDGEFGEFQ